MEKINKLSLPATIIVASLILGGFYYMSQVSKQKSIEKQQEVEQQAQSKQSEKEYLAKQKDACLGIYKVESDKWNNVSGWRYDELKDTCFIQYRSNPKPTRAECDAKYKGDDGKVPPLFFTEWLLCQDGLFENSF